MPTTYEVSLQDTDSITDSQSRHVVPGWDELSLQDILQYASEKSTLPIRVHWR